MRITTISVKGLFDRFDHDIILNTEERITIIFGPNGFGKTMILRILNNLFNSSLRSLNKMPFKEIQITFDTGAALNVRRIQNEESLHLTYASSEQPATTYVPDPQNVPHELPFPLAIVDDVIPSLVRIGQSEWRDLHTGDILGIEDVLENHGDSLPFDSEQPPHRPAIPSWLKELRDSMPVRFIDTERLTDFAAYNRAQRRRRSFSRTLPERTIRRYSEDLARMVQSTLTDYATLSQSLDQSFPARLVVEPTTQPPSIDELTDILESVETRRIQIVDAGLLVQEPESLSVPNVGTMDETRRSVLAVYAQDATQKLEVFNDLYGRVSTFMNIANSRLLYKRVSVGRDGLTVENPDGSEVELEMLSSGEQHEIVLLFDLLFGTTQNSLILVDEPELSLHVAWQRAMLTDLQAMASLSEFNAILATHSPQIIGDRWDIAIELQGPALQ